MKNHCGTDGMFKHRYSIQVFGRFDLTWRSFVLILYVITLSSVDSIATSKVSGKIPKGLRNDEKDNS